MTIVKSFPIAIVALIVVCTTSMAQDRPSGRHHKALSLGAYDTTFACHSRPLQPQLGYEWDKVCVEGRYDYAYPN